MKKLLTGLMTFAMAISLAACGGNETEAPANQATNTDDNQKVTLIVNGNLGDYGLFDEANRGVQRLKTEKGLDVSVVETGDDESKWEVALADAADTDADYIVAISPSMVEPVERVAPQYPDKKFLMIDNMVNYDNGDLDNVYSATFKQNEGSYLAGVAAALASETGKIGFIGGMDIPPINDFLVGYIEGAKSVNPDIKVLISYVGDYYDPAKGKEYGGVQYEQGADVVFVAAGPTSLGVIEAAKEKDKKIIGVDSDQAAAYEANNDTETASHIITSMLKNLSNAIYSAVDRNMAGDLEFGQGEQLGIAEDGVGLAVNKYFDENFSDEDKTKIEEIKEAIVNGEIKVSTAIGMDDNELNDLRDSVRP